MSFESFLETQPENEWIILKFYHSGLRQELKNNEKAQFANPKGCCSCLREKSPLVGAFDNKVLLKMIVVTERSWSLTRDRPQGELQLHV